MEPRYLEESVVDMIGEIFRFDPKSFNLVISACQWERKLGSSENATDKELVCFEEQFLDRYLSSDRKKVKLIQKRLDQI